MKAVLLYPMNALATDQARRINDLLDQPRAHRVSPRGCTSARRRRHDLPPGADERSEIRCASGRTS